MILDGLGHKKTNPISVSPQTCSKGLKKQSQLTSLLAGNPKSEYLNPKQQLLK